MRILPFLLASLVVASPRNIFTAPQQPTEQKCNVLSLELVREIDQLRQDWGIKGTSVAVVQLRDGKWEQDTLGFGVADGAGNAVTEHVSSRSTILSSLGLILLQTLFGIASNSKLFTAITAGLIVADGAITQTTKMKDIIPEWQLMHPIASNGTDLIDLLCELQPLMDRFWLTGSAHRTGLPRHDGFYG
jgi:CubicO group peptidase (beta-lactamase class C family)